MATSPFPTICLTLGLGLALPSLAFAAPPDDNIPKGTAGQADASSGSTELGDGDKFSTTKEVGPEGEGEAEGPEDPHANDATEFDIALGGIFNTGNSQNLSATAVTNFRLRRTIHQFGASLAGNYGAAPVEDGGDYETNVGNVQGLARYDVFFAKRWTAFLQYTARHDTFQGLRYRMNIDPGFAFYAINKTKHRLWFEAGYDFQYDIRVDDERLDIIGDLEDDMGNPILDPDGNPEQGPIGRLPVNFSNHAVRLFAGYSNKLSERVSFDTGLEYLQSVYESPSRESAYFNPPEPEDVDSRPRFRLNYLAGLNTQLVERLSIAVTFTLRYEHVPLPDVKQLDTVTAVSLAYAFF